MQMTLVLIFFTGCKKEEEVIGTFSFSLPEVKTISIIQVGRIVKVKGSAISDSSSPIIEKGICYDTIEFPTVENSRNFSDTDFNTTDRFFPGYFTIKLKSLKAGANYFVRAYATTKGGTAYGETFKLTTESLSNLVVGDNYGGGQLAYILKQGDPGFIDGEIHGIIVAPFDLPDRYVWGGSNLDFIGAGKLNTEIHSNPQGVNPNAASVCNDLILNGYSDWYLPCPKEFALVLKGMEVINNFEEATYWSSTWVPQSNPFAEPIYPTRFMLNVKTSYFYIYDWVNDASNKYKVRPIRYF